MRRSHKFLLVRFLCAQRNRTRLPAGTGGFEDLAALIDF